MKGVGKGQESRKCGDNKERDVGVLQNSAILHSQRILGKYHFHCVDVD